MTEFAAELSQQTGETIPYVNLSADEFRASLIEAGASELLAAALVKAENAIAAGEYLCSTGDLRRLRGRPSTTLSEAIDQALRSPVETPGLPLIRLTK